MAAFTMLIQFIIGLMIIVGIHEFGHLLMAKLFKMRVDRYMIGFPPKVFTFTYKGTEYGLGMIPLGGFVSIAGMIDESFDTKHTSTEPKPWEYRSKPAWQRFVVILGGIIFNVITGIAIYILLTYYVPKVYYSIEEINKHGIEVSKLAEDVGFKRGDKIIKINNKPVIESEDIINFDVLIQKNATYTILRHGVEKVIILPDNFLSLYNEAKKEPFISYLMPFEVQEAMENSSAEEVGLKEKDKIISINGQEVVYYQDLSPVLEKYKGEQINMTILRGQDTLKLEPTVNIEGKLGVYVNMLLAYKTKHYDFSTSIPLGIKKAFVVVFQQVKGFSKIFKGEISARNSVMSPIGIAQLFGNSWNADRFWSLIAFLSMILAFMNLLPIPGLDGGHAIFLVFEMITGKKPSTKVIINAQKVGFTLLIMLIIFAFSNDIYKLFL